VYPEALVITDITQIKCP